MIEQTASWIRGNNFKVNTKIELKNFNLGFISKHNESSYQLFIRAICQNTEDMAVSLYQAGIDYEEYTNYRLFVMIMNTYYFNEEHRDNDFCNLLNKYLMLQGNLDVFVDEVGDLLFIDSKTKKVVLSEELYEEIRAITKRITGYTSIKLEKTQNEGTKKAYLESLLEEMEIAQENQSKQKRIAFSSYITAIVLETSYDYKTVFDINMFQFHSITDMIKKREEWNNLMVGVYTGNIDAKNNKLGEAHWLLT